MSRHYIQVVAPFSIPSDFKDLDLLSRKVAIRDDLDAIPNTLISPDESIEVIRNEI
jgi:hypothetical protein